MGNPNPFYPFDLAAPSSLLDFERWIALIAKMPLRKLDSLHLPVYDPEILAEIEKKISPMTHLSPSQSIGIYNQQYWFRLFDLAQENFPTLVRLFGFHDFNQLIAEPSILQYPPCQWALSKALDQVPLWIEKYYEEEDRNFILQIAQIDAVYHSLIYAPFFPISNDDDLTIQLQPFVKCLAFDGDLLLFRNKLLKHTPEYWFEHEFPELDLTKKHFFSFHQKKEELIYEEISELEFTCLTAFEINPLNLPSKEWIKKWKEKGWVYSFQFNRTPMG